MRITDETSNIQHKTVLLSEALKFLIKNRQIQQAKTPIYASEKSNVKRLFDLASKDLAKKRYVRITSSQSGYVHR